MREQEDASGHGPGGLLSGGLDALQNGAILAATPFAILMCLMCWCPYKTLRRDYREERRQVREVMAHDQNVEKQQMQEIMRRHEAGEPVSPISQNPKE
jgi:choline-glycine betaine transporter